MKLVQNVGHLQAVRRNTSSHGNPLSRNEKPEVTLASAAWAAPGHWQSASQRTVLEMRKGINRLNILKLMTFMQKKADTAPLGNALFQGGKYCAFNSWYRFLVLRFGYISLSFFAHLRAVYG